MNLRQKLEALVSEWKQTIEGMSSPWAGYKDDAAIADLDCLRDCLERIEYLLKETETA